MQAADQVGVQARRRDDLHRPRSTLQGDQPLPVDSLHPQEDVHPAVLAEKDRRRPQRLRDQPRLASLERDAAHQSHLRRRFGGQDMRHALQDDLERARLLRVVPSPQTNVRLAELAGPAEGRGEDFEGDVLDLEPLDVVEVAGQAWALDEVLPVLNVWSSLSCQSRRELSDQEDRQHAALEHPCRVDPWHSVELALAEPALLLPAPLLLLLGLHRARTSGTGGTSSSRRATTAAPVNPSARAA